MTDITATGWYANAFKAWSTKQLGSKPTAELLANIHDLGARPGKQALACSMACRPEGVTGAQIVMACGAPQLNKMRGFITDGLLKRLPAAPDAKNHQVYKLELTPKGTKRIESTRKRAAAADEGATGEPVKAKGAVKAPKARVSKAKAAKPASEARKPAEGHTTEVPANVMPETHHTALPVNVLRDPRAE